MFNVHVNVTFMVCRIMNCLDNFGQTEFWLNLEGAGSMMDVFTGISILQLGSRHLQYFMILSRFNENDVVCLCLCKNSVRRKKLRLNAKNAYFTVDLICFGSGVYAANANGA